MLKDLLEIQSSNKNPSGLLSNKRKKTDEDLSISNDENEFGLTVSETDQKIFLKNNVSTMFWLKSHHLISS
tara:strand:- start:167 stop:379 length:213 start_codon:yes stop_codon:yes gene_type:complete